MSDMRERKFDNRSLITPVRRRPIQASRLAHWPPPHQSAEIIRKIIKQPHPPGEQPARAVRRGWRLKRDLFSDEES